MNDARPRLRRIRASALVAAVAAALVLAWAPPASAHATLIDTDPDEGAVLESVPDLIRFTFNEPVRGVPDGVQVFDAEGESIRSSSRTSDTELLVTLDEEPGEGSLIVAWRVVSADGHPISGTLTLAVGSPSAIVKEPSVDPPDDRIAVALSLSRWPAYAGLLLAVGLVWFATLLLPPGLDKLDRPWSRIRRLVHLSAGVGIVGWVVGLPLTALYLRGTGPGTLAEGATWRSLPPFEVAVTIATVGALLATAWLLPARPGKTSRHRLAGIAGLLALAPLPLSGHTQAEDATVLVSMVDWLHVAAGAVWLGGLVGLGLALPALAGRSNSAAVVVSRFSTAAASVLAALVLSGAFLAWRIVGSWSALVNDVYGQLLLLKICIAAAAAVLAAYNRFRLLPRTQAATGFHDQVAATRVLARTVTAEAGVLVAVLLVTGFLVQTSPPTGEVPVSPQAADTVTERTALGDLEAVITLSPASTGMNTLTLSLRDEAGQPAASAQPPRVRITQDDLAGDVPLAPTGPGTFRGQVVIPRDGVWQVQVSARLSKFDNPVATVDFHVH